MGLVNAETSTQTSTGHNRHPHPMQFSNLKASAINSFCSTCKLPATGPIYICSPCNFLVHPKCYELRKQIKHESHKNHTLHLQTKPVYPGGLFTCDGCRNPGDGLSYHCGPCSFDLHSTCASLSKQITHRSHKHKLRLTFSIPYPSNSFICDICKTAGFGTWLYRCSTCNFDAHLSCVNPMIPHVSTSQSQVMQQPFTSFGAQLSHVNPIIPHVPTFQSNLMQQPFTSFDAHLSRINPIIPQIPTSQNQMMQQTFTSFGLGGGIGGGFGGINNKRFQ